MEVKSIIELISDHNDDKNNKVNYEIALMKRMGGFFFLLGFSIFAAVIVTYYVELNIDKLIIFIDQVNQVTYFFLIIGFSMIIEGVAFYKNAFSLPVLSLNRSEYSLKIMLKKWVNDLIKQFRLFILKTLPYVVLMALGMIYISVPEGVAKLIEYQYHLAICLHIIIIFIITYEVNKGINSVISILKRSIDDSKDRLSIVITILATIVSAIALYK